MAEQKLKKLPLGISTFSEIIQEGYVYVDKTEHIYNMVTGGKYYFISRPRRFGKSLLVSTLAELFSGNKELFRDLWIAQSSYDWPVYPVIRFDFSAIGHRTTADLIINIDVRLDTIARDFKLDVSNYPSIDSKFQEIIIQLSKINKVIILIDEYDKPILDHIDDVKEAKAQREVLKSLYSVIKGSDQYLKFVLLTGVSKFSKTSIFSGINNLLDISMDGRYATLLGYTKKEVENYFVDYLEQLAKNQSGTYVETVRKITDYYDGYQFAEETDRVFNPYSTMACFEASVYRKFWFRTGTPAFLIELIKTGNYPLSALYQPIMSAEELDAFEPNDIKITALLYQAGYLTIKKYHRENDDYTLDFPNHEVASAFNLLLSSTFTQLTYRRSKTYAAKIAQTFICNNMAELQQVLQNFFNEMPYNVHISREFDLQIVIFSVFKLIGIEVDPEVVTSLGRADLVVSLPQPSHKASAGTARLVYVIELKFNKSAKEALDQIQDKKYYEKFLNIGKQITLVGINFESETKMVSLESQEI